MCVRLCDGFYFPINFSTTRNKFEEDAKRCERQCPSHSRLYVYRNPGEDLEDMVDLKDEPYSQLPTAFRFKTAYDPQCTCRGNPWDAEGSPDTQPIPQPGCRLTPRSPAMKNGAQRNPGVADNIEPGDIRHKGRKATNRHRRRQLVRANTSFPVRLATSYPPITLSATWSYRQEGLEAP